MWIYRLTYKEKWPALTYVDILWLVVTVLRTIR